MDQYRSATPLRQGKAVAAEDGLGGRRLEIAIEALRHRAGGLEERHALGERRVP